MSQLGPDRSHPPDVAAAARGNALPADGKPVDSDKVAPGGGGAEAGGHGAGDAAALSATTASGNMSRFDMSEMGLELAGITAAAIVPATKEDQKARMSEFHGQFDKYVRDMHKLQYDGPMAGVRYRKQDARTNVLFVMFAPSAETKVGDENNQLDWDPFVKESNGNLVKCLQHVKFVVPALNFDKMHMTDMFPHRIWETGLDIEADDIVIAAAWLNAVVKLLQPERIFVANKTYIRKLEKNLTFKFEVISHPGYTNRDTIAVADEYKKLAELLEPKKETK